MLGFWRIRRGYKAATAAIDPLVAHSRHRLQEINPSVWQDPYIIGFLGMLITRIAEDKAGPLGTSALARIQTTAWSTLTLETHTALGEKIYALTANGDASFIQGCEDADSVFAILARPQEDPAILTACWEDYFETHLLNQET